MIQKKNGKDIIICDGCGKKHRNSDFYDMLSDKWVAVVINKTTEGNYHFCPECHRVKKDGTLDIYTKDR